MWFNKSENFCNEDNGYGEGMLVKKCYEEILVLGSGGRFLPRVGGGEMLIEELWS